MVAGVAQEIVDVSMLVLAQEIVDVTMLGGCKQQRRAMKRR